MEFEKISFKKYNKIKTSLLISVEGLKTEVYRDNQGIATIGIGINIGQKSLKGIWIKLILYYLFGLIKDLKDIPYARFDSDNALKKIIKDTKSYKYKEYQTLIQSISNNIFKTLETDIRTSTLNKIIKDAIENYCKETEQRQKSNPKASLEELQRLSDEDLKINKDNSSKYLEFKLSEEQAEELFEIISINYELDTLHYFKKKNILFFHKNKNKKEDKKEYYQEFIPFVSATYQGGNFIMQNKLLEKAFNVYKSRFFIWAIIRYFIGKDARRMILQSCIFNFNGKLKKEEESDEEKLDTCIDIFKVLNLIHPTEKQTYFSYFKTMEQHMLKQIKAVKTEYDNKNVDISGYKVYNYVNPNELQALVSILKPYVKYFNDEKFIGKAKFETESDFKKYKEKESDKEYRFKTENIYVMDNSNYNEVLRALREYKNAQETKENILVFIIEKINMEIKIERPSNTYLYIMSVKGNCFDCSYINNPFKENTKQNDKAELFLYEKLSDGKTKTTSLATKELEMKEKETNDQELIANYNGISYCFDILNQLKIERDSELLFTLSNYRHYLENRENSHILKTDLKPDKAYSTLGIELKIPRTQDTFCNNGNFTININDIDLQKIQNYTNNVITEGTPIYIYVQENQQNYVCKLEDKALSRNIYLNRTLEKDEQGNLKLINTKNIFIGFKVFSSIAMANNTFSQKLQICVEDLNKGDKTVKFNTPYCYLIEDKVYEEWREEKEKSVVSLEFDGRALTIITYENDNIARISFQAVSGRPQEDENGKYYFTYEKERQMLKDEGPIPEGEYYITPLSENENDGLQELNVMNKIAGIAKFGKFPGTWYAWGNIRIPIQPKTKTLTNSQGQTIVRDNFFIHGGDRVGSAGCIDLWKNNDTFFKVFLQYVEKYKDEILKKEGKVSLVVKYENNTKVECDSDFFTKSCKIIN